MGGASQRNTVSCGATARPAPVDSQLLSSRSGRSDANVLHIRLATWFGTSSNQRRRSSTFRMVVPRKEGGQPELDHGLKPGAFERNFISLPQT